MDPLSDVCSLDGLGLENYSARSAAVGSTAAVSRAGRPYAMLLADYFTSPVASEHSRPKLSGIVFHLVQIERSRCDQSFWIDILLGGLQWPTPQTQIRTG